MQVVIILHKSFFIHDIRIPLFHHWRDSLRRQAKWCKTSLKAYDVFRVPLAEAWSRQRNFSNWSAITRPDGRPTSAGVPAPARRYKPAHFLCGIFHRLINAQPLITHTRVSQQRASVSAALSHVHTCMRATHDPPRDSHEPVAQHLSRYDNLTLNNELWIITQGERHATGSSGSPRRFDVPEGSPSLIIDRGWVLKVEAAARPSKATKTREAHLNANLCANCLLRLSLSDTAIFRRSFFLHIYAIICL